MNGVFAFLDLLGFSAHLKKDLVAAARLLESQRNILHIKLGDATHYAKQGSELTDFARAHLVSSFDHFLPFSDSLFIASSTPDLFFRQLAHFLIEAFLFTGHTYAHPENPAEPTVVTTRVFSGSGSSREPQHWLPVLWRGGLSFGQVELLANEGIRSGEHYAAPILVGLPVVSAVKLEKTARGPRLFCSADFKTNLRDSEIVEYFVPVAGKDCDEFLWPAFLYTDPTHPKTELLRVHELLLPAVNLWRAEQNSEAKEHFLEFVRLIARSTVKWAELHGIFNQGREQLAQCREAFRLNDLPADIFA